MPMTKEVGKYKRDSRYEWIRVSAMLFVIAIHIVETLPVDTPRRLFYNHAFSLLFYTCNGLFFMLSGKFALGREYPSKEERKRYYQKKFLNLIWPMLFFMFLRSAYSVGGDIFHPEFWELCIRNILSDYAWKDYWFLYALLGNLLIAPFLGKAFTRADQGEIRLFLLLGIGYSALCAYLPYLGFSVEWNYLFAGWTFYFCLGYCMERVVEEKKEPCVMALGGVCFLISLVMSHFGYERRLYDMAPTFVFITCAMWYALKRLSLIRAERINQILLFLGRHSFAVYMVHMKVKDKLVEYVPFNGHYLGYLLLMTVLVALVSLALGVALDMAVLEPLKRLLGKFLFRKRGQEGGALAGTRETGQQEGRQMVYGRDSSE